MTLPFVTYVLTFYLAFYLASILTFYLTFYLIFFPTFFLAFGSRRPPQHPELAVGVQACPTATGAGDMVFGSRRAPLATWLGKTRLTSGGAGIGARGRGQDEREEGRKEGRKAGVPSCTFVKI